MSKYLSPTAGLGLTLCLVYGPAQAALIERLGGLAYYDDLLDITWLTDADLAASEHFGVAGITPGGQMDWATANDWIAGMNGAGANGHLGFNDWRLPSADIDGDSGIDACTTGLVCLDNEFGHMFHYNGVSDGTPGPFGPLYFSYWTGTETSPDFAYRHYIDLGTTIYEDKTVQMGAWAVRSGDVLATPLPGAVWLLGSGLVLLAPGMKRKNH